MGISGTISHDSIRHHLRDTETDFFKPVAALLRREETYLASIGVPSHIYVPREKIIDPKEQQEVHQNIPGSESVRMEADSKDFAKYAALVANNGVIKVSMAISQQVLFSMDATGKVTVIVLSTSADTSVLQNWRLSDLLNYTQQNESRSRKNWWW